MVRGKSVFITSPYRELVHERQYLATVLHSEGYRVWLAEGTSEHAIQAGIKAPLPKNEMDTSDECLLRLSEADLVLAIAGKGLGSEIKGHAARLRARHFELELFSALTQNKPVCILIGEVDDYGETLEFIKAISRSPVKFFRLANIDNKIGELLSYLRKLPSGKSLRRHEHAPASKWTGLSTEVLRRTRSPVFGVFDDTLLHNPRNSDINEDALQRLLVEIRTITSAHLKFGRIWSALREIHGVPFEVLSQHRYFEPICELFREWISVSAYYGVHAHLQTGELAACKNLFRLSLKANTPLRPDFDISALYNVGKKLPLASKFVYMKQLERRIFTHIHKLGPHHNHFLMLGSLHMQMLSPLRAASYYRRSLDIMDRDPVATDQAHAMLKLQLAGALISQFFIPGVRKEVRDILQLEGIYAVKTGHAGERIRALNKCLKICKYFQFRDLLAEFDKMRDEIPDANSYLDQTSV